MLPNSAIKSIVRCSGEGCEAALYGGGVGSSASAVGGSDKYCWVNPAVSRRDTSVTVELKPCEEVMKGLLMPSYNPLQSSSSSSSAFPPSSPAFAMLMHEALNEASLSISLAPRVPKSSFPTACICSVTAAVAPKNSLSSSSVMKDVVIREWMLLESRTAANHFATQISVRTLRNINSLVNGDEDDGDNDRRRSTSRDSSLLSSSPNRNFFSSNAPPPPRMFLTLRFVGCCDSSDRHEISSLALGYVFSSIGKEMLAEAAKLVGGSYYPQLTPPHPSQSSRQSPLSSGGGGGRARSSQSRQRGEEMRDQENEENEQENAVIGGNGQRHQHAQHLLTAPSSVDVSQTQTAASDRSTPQIFTVHHQQHRSPVSPSPSPSSVQHRGSSRHKANSADRNNNTLHDHQQHLLQRIQYRGDDDHYLHEHTTHSDDATTGGGPLTFSPDARSPPHPSFSSSPSSSRGFSNNENSNNNKNNKITSSNGSGTREGTTRDIEINGGGGGGVGTTRNTAPSMSSTTRHRPPLSGLQTNKIGSSLSPSAAPIREEGKEGREGKEGGTEEVLAHMLFNNKGTNNKGMSKNAWRHTQDEATTHSSLTPTRNRDHDAKDNNNTSTNTKLSTSTPTTIQNTTDSSAAAARGPTTLLGTWRGGIATNTLGNEQATVDLAHAREKIGRYAEEDGERGRAGSGSSRDTLSAPTAQSGRLTMGLSTAAPSPASSQHRDGSQPQASREGSIALNKLHYAYAAGAAPVTSPSPPAHHPHYPHHHLREGSPHLYAYDPRDVSAPMMGSRSPVPTLPSLEALGVSPPAAPSPPSNRYKYEHEDRRRPAPQPQGVGGGEEGSLRPSPSSFARSHASKEEYSPPTESEGYYRYGNMQGVAASASPAATAAAWASSTPQLLMTLSPPPPLAGSPTSYGPIHNRGVAPRAAPHTNTIINSNTTVIQNKGGGGGEPSPSSYLSSVSPLSGRRERAPAAAAVVTKRDTSGNFIISTLEEEAEAEEGKAAMANRVRGKNNNIQNISPPHHVASHSSLTIPRSIPTRAYVVGSGWGDDGGNKNNINSSVSTTASSRPAWGSNEHSSSFSSPQLPTTHTATATTATTELSPSLMLASAGPFHIDGARREHTNAINASSYSPSVSLHGTAHTPTTSRSQQGATKESDAEEKRGASSSARSGRLLNEEHIGTTTPSPRSGDRHDSFQLGRMSMVNISSGSLQSSSPHLRRRASVRDVGCSPLSAHYYLHSLSTDRDHQNHKREDHEREEEENEVKKEDKRPMLQPSKVLVSMGTSPMSSASEHDDDDDDDEIPSSFDMSSVGTDRHHQQFQRRQQSHTTRNLLHVHQKGESSVEPVRATTEGVSGGVSRSLTRGSSAFPSSSSHSVHVLPSIPSTDGTSVKKRSGFVDEKEVNTSTTDATANTTATARASTSVSRPPPRRSVSSSSVMPDLSQFVAVNKGCAVTIGGKEFAVNVRSGSSNTNTNSISSTSRVSGGGGFTSSLHIGAPPHSKNSAQMMPMLPSSSTNNSCNGDMETMRGPPLPLLPLLPPSICPRHPLGYEAMAMEQAKVLQTAKASVDVLAGAEAYSPEEDTLWLAAELLSRDKPVTTTIVNQNKSDIRARSSEGPHRSTSSLVASSHRHGGDDSRSNINNNTNNTQQQQQQRSHSVPNAPRNPYYSSHAHAHAHAHAHHYPYSSSSPLDLFASSPHHHEQSFSPQDGVGVRFRAPPKTSFVAVTTSSSKKSTTTVRGGAAANDDDEHNVDTQVGAVLTQGGYASSAVGFAANTHQHQSHSHHRLRRISWHEGGDTNVGVINVAGGHGGALEGLYRDVKSTVIVSPALPAPPSLSRRRDLKRNGLGLNLSDHADVGVAIEINGSLVERERQHDHSKNGSSDGILCERSHAGGADGNFDGEDYDGAANRSTIQREDSKGGDDGSDNEAQSISKGHNYRHDVSQGSFSVVSAAEYVAAEQAAYANGNVKNNGYCSGIEAEEGTTEHLQTSRTVPMGRHGSMPHELAATITNSATTSHKRVGNRELSQEEDCIGSGSGAARLSGQVSESRGEDEDEDDDDLPPPSSPPPVQGSLAFAASNTIPHTHRINVNREGEEEEEEANKGEQPQGVLFEGPQSVHAMSRLADEQLSRWKAQNGPHRASQATLPDRPTRAPVEGENKVKEGDPVVGQTPYEVSVWCLKHHARTAGTARRIVDFRKCEDIPSRTLVEAYGVEALAPRVLMCMRHVDGRMWKEGGNGNTVRAEARSSSSGGEKGRSRSGSTRSLIGAVANMIGGDDEEKREDGNPFVELTENTVVLIGQRALEDSAIHREYVRDPRRCVVVRQSLADQTRWARGIADNKEEKSEDDHPTSEENNGKGLFSRRAAPKTKTLDEQYKEHRSRSRSMGASVSTSYERVVAAFELTSEADWHAVVSILRPFIPISSFL